MTIRTALFAALLPMQLSAQTDLLKPTANDKPIAIVDVTVIPMDRERTLPRQTVIVRGDRIVALGPVGQTSVPADAIRIDGRGKFLMPGLTDMHAHFQAGAGTLADPAGQAMALFLANGVTTIRALAAAPTARAVRDRIRSGELLGPQMFVYSPSLNQNSVKTAADAAPMIQGFKEQGFDGLKTHGGVTAEVYDSIVAAARRTGLPLSGHITPGYGLQRAINAGQQIEHLDGFLHALLPANYSGPQFAQIVADPAILSQIDTARIPALAREIAQRRIWNGPTLALFKTIVGDSTPQQFLARPTTKYLPPQARTNWTNQMTQMKANDGPADGRRAFVEIRNRIVRALHQAGAKLLAGSDSPQFFMTVGDALQREVASFVEAGLSPYAALETATRNPAEHLGLANMGTIAAGKRADLLLLNANPLASIHNTRQIAGVMAAGRWISREHLDALLAEIASRHNQ